MPEARTKDTLERGPVADIYRNSLARISSVFGRLTYLSKLRSVDTGRYEHAGLSQIFGEQEADKALRKQHVLQFRTWLALSAREQMEDLRLYLDSIGSHRRVTLDTWRKLAPYRSLTPINATSEEKRLFVTDLEAILRSLTAEVGLAWPDPNA